MSNASEVVAHYIAQLRAGETEAGYYGLLDLGAEASTELIAEFSACDDAAIRETIVEILRQFRRAETVEFFGRALFDRSPEVWKQALDGLVTIAGPAAAGVLAGALAEVRRQNPGNGLTEDWLIEAMDQIRE